MELINDNSEDIKKFIVKGLKNIPSYPNLKKRTMHNKTQKKSVYKISN